ncbi:MAG: flavin monoamine oxidase family protein [Acidimicrobiia bacterium]|nr:flavin monoamine oxidase family protein [Acidimicrobiia bacterium]
MEHETDVCIVGAGYAGLTAARRLTGVGKSVIVLEARDRVGGRVWTQPYDSFRLDFGGTFLGPDQDAVRKLVSEFGLETFPTNHQGEKVMAIDGSTRRYGGLIPKLNVAAIGSLGVGMARLDAMAKKVPLDAPWADPRARRWDQQSAGAWLNRHAHVPVGRHLLGATVRGVMCCDPSEVSMLHFLYVIRSAKGLSNLLSTKGGYQQDQLVDGAQSMANAIAEDLGPSLCLQTPARSITRDDAGVVVGADGGVTVRAGHVIVAVPPTLAAQLRYDPPLPTEKAQLLDRMPAGSVLKMLAVYDDAFWRADGLAGETVGVDLPIEMTLDGSPPSGRPGVIMGFAFGPLARQLGALSDNGRRSTVLADYALRFGPKASNPVDYFDHEWANEPWSRGGMMSRWAPGTISQFGAALRTPVGRIHWAGTETATVSHGTIDGAIRSGERAALEVVETS